MAVLIGELHRLVDRGVRRHAIEEQDLVGAERMMFLIHGCTCRGRCAPAVEHPVDPPAPAQRALHQLVHQRLIARILRGVAMRPFE
jgi:hypothetical protein